MTWAPAAQGAAGGAWCTPVPGRASALGCSRCRRVAFPTQLIRQFQALAAGCNTDDYASVAPPAGNMHTYDQAVANSCTDAYM